MSMSARSTSRIAFASLSFCIVIGASAQSLSSSPVIFRSGPWEVHRTTDAMTDATVCTAVYKNNFGVQLSENMLTIAVPDGVKNVQLRFDDSDPQAVRPATHSEFENSRVEITGGDFHQVIDSSRLRYQVTTAANSVVTGDIDLGGVFQTHDNVRAGCAGSPIATPTAQTSDACTPALRDRMSHKGIAAQDIEEICSTASQ
jgi:hypothetical protein